VDNESDPLTEKGFCALRF